MKWIAGVVLIALVCISHEMDFRDAVAMEQENQEMWGASWTKLNTGRQ